MKNILLVDDDSSVLDVVTRALVGYRVWTARDPDEALQLLTQLAPLHLLITDYFMPSMTGEELIGHFRERRPGLKVLMVTGHSDILDRENPSWWANEAHLPKPVVLSELRREVTRLIGPPEKAQETAG